MLYAATDALACVRVYEAIVSRQSPVFDHYDPAIATVGSKVWMCSSSHSDIIAEGTVVENPNTSDNSGRFMGVFAQKVTNERVVVKIDKVLVPGAKIPIALKRMKTVGETADQPKLKYTLSDIVGAGHLCEGHVLVHKTNLRRYTALVPGRPCEEDFEAGFDAADAVLEGLSLAEQALLQLPSPKIKGDIFHLIKGILDKCKKRHPGFGMFARALGDAMLPAVGEDLDAAEERLRDLGLSDDAIAAERKYHWKAVFLRFARRSPGTSRVAQLRRFNLVASEFQHHVDASNEDELLIRPDAMKKIVAAQKKIAEGFFTDPVGVDMFKTLGKDQYGREKWQNCRGTNALEGFHRHIRDIMRRHFMSPRLAVNVLRTFIHRWNLKRARGLRGRADGFHHYYDQGDS